MGYGGSLPNIKIRSSRRLMRHDGAVAALAMGHDDGRDALVGELDRFIDICCAITD